MNLKQYISERKSFDDFHGLQTKLSPFLKAVKNYPFLSIARYPSSYPQLD
ncbi:hypothetical protein F383_24144 [Gossypium arboreum]|uniref:Uncharacterized protein n=1 Tax=Gossypium arboreum TaxID=29729 RepID=A0A0B0MPC9_GOSAR|nr:hypothetical protein F383_24144 [Gossypium arboreum]